MSFRAVKLRLVVGLAVVPEGKAAGCCEAVCIRMDLRASCDSWAKIWSKTAWRNVTVVVQCGFGQEQALQHFNFHHLWEQAVTWQASCTCLRVMHQVLSFLRCCCLAFGLPVGLQTAEGISVSWVLAFTGPPKQLSSPKRPRKNIRERKHTAVTRCNLVQALHAKPVEMFPFRPRKRAWWQKAGMQRLSEGRPLNFSNPSRRFGC